MTAELSHTEAHAAWSATQLDYFRGLAATERINAVKSGALENWTEADRDTALDLLGPAPDPAATTAVQAFEPAHHPLPRVATRRGGPSTLAAFSGWGAIVAGVAAHAYGFV